MIQIDGQKLLYRETVVRMDDLELSDFWKKPRKVYTYIKLFYSDVPEVAERAFYGLATSLRIIALPSVEPPKYSRY